MKDVADVFWEVCKNMEIESFIDVGTGITGIVGMHYWEKKKTLSESTRLTSST